MLARTRFHAALTTSAAAWSNLSRIRSAFVCASGQHIDPIHPVVQSVKPECRFPFGLLIELLYQQREFPRFLRFRVVTAVRSESFLQAVLLSSYSCMLSMRSLRSTVVTRFFATMDRSDSRPVHDLRLCIPERRRFRFPFPVLPGLPGSLTNLSLRAVPNHPGKPCRCNSRFFPAGIGLHHLRQAGRISTHVTRPNRVHFRYGSQVRIARLRLTGSLRCTLAPLHVEREIHMVDSFHSTRFASLTGTPKAPKTQRNPSKGFLFVWSRQPGAGF